MEIKNNLPWVEKYRPTNINNIYEQNEIILTLNKSDKYTFSLPHCLFYGPPGTGKTTTALAICFQLFGKNLFKERVLELNASDERGINVVREKIKNYSQESINNIEGLPPWKIIILDEADNMTSESQYALRRIMEEYSKITRFCVICNYHYKIIDPIVSRCALFRFKPIPKLFIKDQLKLISKKEKLKCSINIINKISDYSRGDLRKAINFLQRCYNCFGIEMNSSIIDEISGVVDDKILIAFINNCIKVNKTEVIDYINEFHNSGFSLVNQILSIHNIILSSKNFDSIEKSKLIILLGNIDQQLIKGCDEFIQLYKLAYYIMSLKSNLKT